MRVAIADDEMLARKRASRLLQAIEDIEVAAECADGAQLLEVVASGDIDAVFLDIHMPGLDGTEVAALLGPSGPLVVFLTAHPDHAVDAFTHGAVDYILKPIEAARMRIAVDRLRDRLETAPPGPPGRIALPTHNGAVLIDFNEISHARIDGASVVVITRSGRHFTELRLADLERRLPSTLFLRVHRQALVNIDQIDKLTDTPSGGYLARMRDGSTLAVSRAAARKIRRDWGLPR